MFLFIQFVFYDYIVLRICIWVFNIFVFIARHKIADFDMADVVQDELDRRPKSN